MHQSKRLEDCFEGPHHPIWTVEWLHTCQNVAVFGLRCKVLLSADFTKDAIWTEVVQCIFCWISLCDHSRQKYLTVTER